MIDKTYQPGEVERRIAQAWEEAQAFRAGRPERAQAEPYAIVIPPPNVTGSLHMGHALNNTLQDVLSRFQRMRGRDVLWQPGTDHAGIATQMVVERQLMERHEPGRRAMGREKFLARVWEWKAESGDIIVNQLKRLGASCDWSRLRFTMDEGLSRAVIKVFVALYREGLIYKDKRLVNWDPKLLTAISDLEVQQVEVKGQLYYFKYLLEGLADTFITVATTRPETMLGDTAVAVHPDDERYEHLVGRNAILPLVGRKIPIIADEYSDPEKGTGAVKVTPAHDFNDFEVGKRHDLPLVNIFDAEAKLRLRGNREFLAHVRGAGDTTETTLELIPWTIETLDRLDRFAARKKIVERLEQRGLVEKIEPHTHVVPHGDRSGVVIEPFLTSQWYVDAKTLAAPAINAVRENKTTFVPKNWEKTYFDWMENIQPWCISRQLWWGHQIPAWYGRKETERRAGELRGFQSIEDDPEIFVAATEAEAIALARAKYGCEIRVLDAPPRGDLDPIFQEMDDDDAAGKPRWEPIWRDEDVLDTWFSSALWPFSTLGWPDETSELKRYYPTSALVTGFDIIFFWVARMMMMGLHFMRKERPDAPSEQWVPFRDVYIHALVRDERGAKMSKSKGNVIDPLAVIDDYGADALRFTLAAMAAQGRDIKLSAGRLEGSRNFATKLWNAARFAEMNDCATVADFNPKSTKEILNRWIAHETAKASREVTQAIEDYKFNDAAGALYRFVWNIYCDWYLELAKPLLTGPDGPAKDETRAVVAWARDEILKLLHPFMPFITEELWAVTAPSVIADVAQRRAGPSAVIPDARPGARSGIQTQGPESHLDSGFAPSARPGMTGRGNLLALTEWPRLEGLEDDKAEAEIGWLIDLVNAIRSVRTELNIASDKFPVFIQAGGEQTFERLVRWRESLLRLGRLADVSAAHGQPRSLWKNVLRFFYYAWWRPNDYWQWRTVKIPALRGAVQIIVGGETVFLPLADVVDLAAERVRLQKEMAKADADIARVDAKLGNADFLARAPEDVVDGEREKRDEAQARREKILQALERLKGAA